MALLGHAWNAGFVPTVPLNCPPGRGISIDEAAAKKYPFTDSKNGLNGGWGEIQKLDGTVIKQ